jgi:hypothetical protein
MKPSKASLDFYTLHRLRRGFFADARYLNPPGGDDCTHILRRPDGSLGWCDRYGEQLADRRGNVSRFSDAELREP